MNEQITEVYLNNHNSWKNMLFRQFNLQEDEIVDVIQNGLERIIKFSDSFQGLNDCKFSSWCYTVIRNAAVNYIRDKNGIWYGCNNEISETDMYLPNYDDGDSSQKSYDEILHEFSTNPFPNPEEELILDGMRDQVYAILKHIPEKSKRIFIARVLEQEPYMEIAKREGMSYEAVRLRVFKVRQTLREYLPEDMFQNLKKDDDCE